MAELTKNLSSVVGVDNFYYAVINSDTDESTEYGEMVRLPFLQDISIETEQEVSKAFGDNRVAEMAVSTGVTTVEFQFHALPLEDRVALLGLESGEGGVIVQRSQVNPPYVGIMLEKTKADGTTEIVGLTKGMFTLPSDEASTKEDSLEFGSDTISGEFSARMSDDVTQLFAQIGEDDKEKREEVIDRIFNRGTEEGTG